MRRACFATVYGAGLAPRAPGTMGSLVAALLAMLMLQLENGFIWLIVGVVISTIFGTRASTRYMVQHNVAHDPSEIVIDEVAGQWLTYVIGIWVLAMLTPATNAATAVFIFAGFLLFRLFDILKPWPISWADRHVKGGFGVMFDDLLAAIPAGLCLSYGIFYWFG